MNPVRNFRIADEKARAISTKVSNRVNRCPYLQGEKHFFCSAVLGLMMPNTSEMAKFCWTKDYICCEYYQACLRGQPLDSFFENQYAQVHREHLKKQNPNDLN
jgi:hypothetical protein